jgi:WD40 repeat protein
MDIKRFTNFWVLILVLIVTLTVPLPNVMAQDHTRWSLPDGAKARLGKGYATEIVYSPDGALLAVGSTIGVWLHDAQSGKALSLIAIDMDAINNVSFSPDGKTIATGSGRVIGDRRVHLWDVDTATLKNTLLGHRGPIFSVAFSPDGKTIVSAGVGVHLWDVDTGTFKKTLGGDYRAVFSVAFSPDGKTIATGGSGGRVYLRDVDTATLKHTLLGHRGQVSKVGHQGSVSSVSFSPDGKTIATGSSSISGDGRVYLWDVDTATLKKTLVGHQGSVSSVSFSPDGKTIATGGSGGRVYLRDVEKDNRGSEWGRKSPFVGC